MKKVILLLCFFALSTYPSYADVTEVHTSSSQTSAPLNGSIEIHSNGQTQTYTLPTQPPKIVTVLVTATPAPTAMPTIIYRVMYKTVTATPTPTLEPTATMTPTPTKVQKRKPMHQQVTLFQNIANFFYHLFHV